jgi:hypothetical protein
MRNKGVKIIDFPSNYDLKSIIPFILLNDHSILLVKNPNKDVIPLFKSIVKTGLLWYKSPTVDDGNT